MRLAGPVEHIGEHFFKGVCICPCVNCMDHLGKEMVQCICHDCPKDMCGLKAAKVVR